MKIRPEEAEGKERAVLIYDGSCPVCSKTVAWIEKNEREGAFEMVPCQNDDVPVRFPHVERAACMRAMHLVLPDGRTLAGEQALPEIAKRLENYSGTADLFRIPGAQTLSRAFYRWFADRRYSIARLLGMKVKQDRGQRNLDAHEYHRKERGREHG
jgi:predicted DCC family thiol-disulfide oxidoreductase YuxK